MAGNEKKKTDGKSTNHEKKKLSIANIEKYQNNVLPGKIKNDGEEMANNDDELFEEKTSCGPWNDKKEVNA